MDFSIVTEATGTPVTREALSMMYTRYRLAAEYCENKDVLKVACGSGQGLGYLATKVGRVVGGDCTEKLLRVASRHYHGRMPLVRLDAQMLPFKDQSFDVVILYEAIYYLVRPDQFLAESRRVLRDQGTILISTVNKEWSDFNPSPLSARYFSAQELGELLKSQGFNAELYGAFPVCGESIKDRTLSLLKRAAVQLHLIPKT
ncbi:MAG: class I SAM-dependent methyltransferase, partial [Planctomycetes bacterium]|nr:class I SAM-dependent methyltransferase [Planctomycetota bacterium]